MATYWLKEDEYIKKLDELRNNNKSVNNHYNNVFGADCFQEWLAQEMGVSLDSFNLNSYIEDLDEAHGNNGSDDYELSPFRTKNKKPSFYSYDVYYLDYDDEGEQPACDIGPLYDLYNKSYDRTLYRVSDLCIAKATAEYEDFVNVLKEYPAEDVIEKAYEICFKRQILDLLQNGDLTDGQYTSLMTLDKPLEAIYQDWVSCEDPHLDILDSVINDFSADLEKSLYPSPKRIFCEYIVEQEEDLGNGYSLCLCKNENAKEPYVVCNFNFNKPSAPTSVFTTKSYDQARASFEIRSRNVENELRQLESELEL